MIHPLHIKYCENFILGSSVGFQEILHQKQVFLTSRGNWPVHAIYLSAGSCDIMYCMWESKSKLDLFYQLQVYLHILSHLYGPRLRHILESSLKLSLCIYQSDSTHMTNMTYISCRICVVVTCPWDSPNDLVLSTKWAWNFWLWSICCNHSVTYIYWD